MIKYLKKLNEKKKRRKIRNTILSQMKQSLEGIYERCRNLAEEHNLRCVPLVYYKKSIDMARPTSDRMRGNAFLVEYNTMLSKLYKASDDMCDQYETDEVSLLDIRTGIELIFDGYKTTLLKMD